MSSDEETFRRLAVELRILEGTAEALQSRINLVRAALTELRVASMTLEGVEKEKKNASLFVPIGGGSYVKAKLDSAEEVIVGIGADVAVERTMKEARDNLENRIAELAKTGNTLGQQLNDVIGKIGEHRSELEGVTAKLRERERTSGVRKT
ncbi:MAG: prefoldin subunit alpha [Candidatus Bathyarchaeota archaeon]|nr:prefoldin subunit alpha [Candidatus Bathyarchaeota archaeon]